MSRKSSVYFGEPLLALTANLTDEDSVSGRINRAAERYLEILKIHGRLALTLDEDAILRGYLSSTYVDLRLIRHLADEIADTEYTQPKSWMTNVVVVKRLVEKLRAASFADLVATVERLGF